MVAVFRDRMESQESPLFVRLFSYSCNLPSPSFSLYSAAGNSSVSAKIFSSGCFHSRIAAFQRTRTSQGKGKNTVQTPKNQLQRSCLRNEHSVSSQGKDECLVLILTSVITTVKHVLLRKPHTDARLLNNSYFPKKPN